MIVVYYAEHPCLHHKQEIAKADSQIMYHRGVDGDVVTVTGSEHYILRLLQAVRSSLLRTDEIRLFCNGTQIDVDTKGEFIQPWPDDLFEADFYLRFSNYPDKA